MKTITFIGNGQMALSIAQGLKDKYNIEVAGRDMKNLDTFESKLETNIDKYNLKNFDITNKTVILCIKPNNIQEVGKQLNGQAHLLLSVLAGVSIHSLALHYKAKSIIRSMPNLAASMGQSMTTLTGDEAGKSEALSILNAIGDTLWLESEKAIDIATALAGSGPAYLALIAEALSDGAVKQGLKREDAMAVMKGLFTGFSALIQDVHPAQLKDAVMSPGGTTAAGYSALEEGNVRASCIFAIEKAYQKSQELKENG